jgi:hypothetical protein
MSENWFAQFSSSFSEYLQQNHATIVALWNDAPAWTRVVGEAVASASKATFGTEVTVARRGDRDGFKCEYLSIDCTVHDGTWGRPILMVELENNPRQLEYSTWKLLCARPNHRLVIGYRRRPLDEVVSSLSQITRLHPEESIHFLLADWDKPAQTGDQWATHYAGVVARGESITKHGLA